MKRTHFVKVLLLLGAIFVGCQQETNTVSPTSTKSNRSKNANLSACCVTDPSQTNQLIELERGVKVEIWNDETTVYYKVWRLDPNANNDDQIGNLKAYDEANFSIFFGSNLNVYEFTRSSAGYTDCSDISTRLEILGAGGPPIEVTVVHTIKRLCPPPPPVCITYQNETGFGGSMSNKGAGKAWWYYYSSGSGTQPIFAGQSINVGTVSINSAGNFSINLTNGWELNPNTTESVKIQAYNVLPASRPAAGLFTGYKGSSLTGKVSTTGMYYVVHLDVRKCSQWQ